MFLESPDKKGKEEKTNEEVTENVMNKVDKLVAKHNWKPINWSQDHTVKKEETGR